MGTASRFALVFLVMLAACNPAEVASTEEASGSNRGNGSSIITRHDHTEAIQGAAWIKPWQQHKRRQLLLPRNSRLRRLSQTVDGQQQQQQGLAVSDTGSSGQAAAADDGSSSISQELLDSLAAAGAAGGSDVSDVVLQIAKPSVLRGLATPANDASVAAAPGEMSPGGADALDTATALAADAVSTATRGSGIETDASGSNFGTTSSSQTGSNDSNPDSNSGSGSSSGGSDRQQGNPVPYGARSDVVGQPPAIPFVPERDLSASQRQQQMGNSSSTPTGSLPGSSSINNGSSSSRLGSTATDSGNDSINSGTYDGSYSDGSSGDQSSLDMNSSIAEDQPLPNDFDAAAQQLPLSDALAPDTGSGSPGDAASSDSSSDALDLSDMSSLEKLLQGISASWQARQSGGALNGPGIATNVWVDWGDTMDILAQRQPQLAAFARLARSNPLMQRVIHTVGQPALLLAPTNAALTTFLTNKLNVNLTGSNNGGSSNISGSSTTSNITWQDLVEMANQRTGASIELLLRHMVTARQPQLLDQSGDISSRLLVHNRPLIFNSLVLQTGLGTYIQVAELPDTAGSQMLRAAAALNASLTLTEPPRAAEFNVSVLNQTKNNASNTSQPAAGNLKAYNLAFLHVGTQFRALSALYQLETTRLLVVPINGVLEDADEVINSRTAARLRGAFGWSPEDEQALLSRVYLDPHSSYWARTSVVPSDGMSLQQMMNMFGGEQQSQQQGGAGAPAPSTDTSSANSSNSSSSSNGSSSAGGRRLMQDPDLNSTSGPSSSGSGSTDAAADAGTAATGSNASGGSTSSSAVGRPSSTDGVVSTDAGTDGSPTSGQAGSSSTGNRTEGNSSSAGSVFDHIGAASSTAENAGGQNAATGSTGGGGGGNSSSSFFSSTAAGGLPGVTPAGLAEILARQQEQLLQINMAGALAANLMTFEGLSAWTTATVLDPAAVFADDQWPEQSKPGDGSQQQTNPSSTAVEIAVDWATPCCTLGGGASCDNSNSSENQSNSYIVGIGSCCWAHNGCNAAAGGSSNGSNAGQAAQADSCPGTSNATVRVGAFGLSPCPGGPAHCFGTLSMPLLVGLEPYQIFPRLGDDSIAAAVNITGNETLTAAVESSDREFVGSSQQEQQGSSRWDGGQQQGPPPSWDVGQQQRQQQQGIDSQAGGQRQEAVGSAAASGSSSNSSNSSSNVPESIINSSSSIGSSNGAGTYSGSSSANDGPNNSSDVAAASGSSRTPLAVNHYTGRGLLQDAANATPASPVLGPVSAVQYSPPAATGDNSARAVQPDGAVPSGLVDGGNTSNSFVQTPASSTGNPAGNAGAGGSDGSDGSAAGRVWMLVSTEELAYSTVLQLAELLASGNVTPQQLAALYSNRLKRYDPMLHAVVTFTDDLAAQAAAAAHQTLLNHSQANTAAAGSSTLPPSLLTGIPFGLKDLMAVPGYPTTWGLKAFQNRTISTPSWPFAALSGTAGSVLLAKTATGELAWGDTWFDDIVTRNPWNTNTGSCGSSAGSAVAVSAGLLPFSVGTETWGSIVCPAATVGVTAYRPTGGTIPGFGIMQISSSLDKVGIFCRQVLDCAIVADALMDTQTACANSNSSVHPQQQQAAENSGSTAAAGQSCQHLPGRFHRQNAAQGDAFNITEYHTSALGRAAATQQQWVAGSGSPLPPSLEALPNLANLCIGYLEDTSEALIETLQGLNPGCLKGPLPPPGNSDMVQDVLSVILQAEVAVNFEGMWLEGYINDQNHWYPMLQLGQVAPAVGYLKAQRLRAVLLAQTQHYFTSHSIQVLLKPAESDVGIDGLPALLDMPEIVLPVGFTVAQQSGPGIDDTALNTPNASSYDTSQQQQNSGQSSDSGSSSSGPDAAQVWLQPEVNSVVALPGWDAAIVSVGAAFQSVTGHHLVRPPLPATAMNNRVQGH